MKKKKKIKEVLTPYYDKKWGKYCLVGEKGNYSIWVGEDTPEKAIETYKEQIKNLEQDE